MDNRFGYPLFTSKELLQAYGYLFYNLSEDNEKQLSKIFYSKEFYTMSKSERESVIARANVKRVSYYAIHEFIPDLSSYLKCKGIESHIVVFNPDLITDTLIDRMKVEPKKNKEVHLKFTSLISETLGFSSIYFYIEPGNNTRLEQCIKTRYKDFIFISGKGIYVRLCPQDTFDLIYDFIENVFNLI